MIDRQLIQSMRQDLQEAVKEVADKYRVNIDVGRASYDRAGRYANFKLEVGAISDAGEVYDPERAALEVYAPLYKLPVYGTTLTLDGEQYKIVGYRTKAPKRPIVIERTRDGKRFVATVQDVTK